MAAGIMLKTLPNQRYVLAAAGLLGLSAIVTQTIFLREMLTVFAGNELILGVVLGSWMILTGAGALLGRLVRRLPRSLTILLSGLTFLAILPLATLILLYSLRNVIFQVGTLIGPAESVASSLVLLLPYCVTAGALFTLCVYTIAEDVQVNTVAHVYTTEAVGSVVGGLIFNIALLTLLSNFQALIALSVVNLVVCALLALQAGRIRLAAGAAVLLASVGIVAFGVDPDRWSREKLYPDQSVLAWDDSPYGKLTVTRHGDQTNVYENGVLLFSSGDVVQAEESVHYALVQHPLPRRVLMISGGFSGAIDEVLKHGVQDIDYVEMNPALITLGERMTSAARDARVHVIREDGRRFVRSVKQPYDVALVNVPEPGTAQINRFYTLEFLQDLKQALTPNGIVSLGSLPSADYYAKDARTVASTLVRTLKQVFHNVIIVPGLTNKLIASDGPLTYEVARLIKERNIQTTYVNQYYVDDALMAQRGSSLLKDLDPRASLNTDFAPVAYYRQLLYWLGYFTFAPAVWVAAGAAFLVVMMWRMNAVTLGVSIGGLAGASLEILLLMAFQVLYGYVYQIVGLVVTSFMAGLAVGAFLAGRNFRLSSVTRFAALQGLVAAYAFLLPIVFDGLRSGSFGGTGVVAVFLFLAFIAAVLVGAEFSTAATLLRRPAVTVAADLYGLDLLGSAAGAFASSAVLIPLLGVAHVSFLIGTLSLVGAAVIWMRRTKYSPLAA